MPEPEFVDVADDDEIWDGEMESYDIDDTEVLVVKVAGGYHAYNGICPHQSVALVEGTLDGTRLTCRAHEWTFDITTGEGLNPRDVCLRRHAVRVVDGVVEVSRHPVPAGQPAGRT